MLFNPFKLFRIIKNIRISRRELQLTLELQKKQKMTKNMREMTLEHSGLKTIDLRQL
jgi:hypothetical protein